MPVVYLLRQIIWRIRCFWVCFLWKNVCNWKNVATFGALVLAKPLVEAQMCGAFFWAPCKRLWLHMGHNATTVTSVFAMRLWVLTWLTSLVVASARYSMSSGNAISPCLTMSFTNYPYPSFPSKNDTPFRGPWYGVSCLTIRRIVLSRPSGVFLHGFFMQKPE